MGRNADYCRNLIKGDNNAKYLGYGYNCFFSNRL